MPKFKNLFELAKHLKEQSAVHSEANVAKGTRPRIKTVKTTTPVTTQKVVVLDTKPVTLPEFKPYYITGENPNILTAEQQELKDQLVKSAQIDLTKHQRELAKRGENTPAFIRKATASALATNPGAIITSPEGEFALPYEVKLSKLFTNGEPYGTVMATESVPEDMLSAGEVFGLAQDALLPYGPNALWRKWEQPLRDATNSWDIIGQLPRKYEPAPEMSLQQLGYGLKQMAPYLKRNGGILSAKSGIHIKKRNRGKFTSWCGGKVTSECIARGKRSSNPAIRKRATFAANSRKWAKKHDSGGKFLNWWKH